MVTTPTNMDVISRALRLNTVINWEFLKSARRFIEPHALHTVENQLQGVDSPQPDTLPTAPQHIGNVWQA